MSEVSALKIIILQGAFLPVPPIMGGAVEKMWYLLGQKFAARGQTVLHVSKKWSGLPDHEWIGGVEHVRVAGHSTPGSMIFRMVLDAAYTLRILSVIPQDADVIVTNTFWAPLIVPLFSKAKIYVDVARMPKGQMRFYTAAARLRATSSPVATAIRAELPDSRHFQVGMIPNPLPYEANEAVDISSKRRSILYCGRIHPEKGLELLASAANALPEGWTLSIVGPWKTSEGGGGESYLGTLKTLFDASKVHFIEPIYDIGELNLLYKQAAIFVYPSVAEQGETFGLAPLEAMAWGAVPLVSDLACFKDFIVDGENGLIFNHRVSDARSRLSACLSRLIDDQALRYRLAERALKVRVTHSPDSISDLFLSDFERVMA